MRSGRRVPTDKLRGLTTDLGELAEAAAIETDLVDVGETAAFEIVTGEGECAS
jgi:hypothetical protein